jgi:O-antigen/teichoic acid export membrane protein
MSEIAKKSVETFVTRVAMQVLSIGGAIVIARTLGASGKGVFTFATSILAMLQMANAGQSSAIAWQYTKRARSPAALLKAMLTILGGFAIPVVLALALTGILVPGQSALIAVAVAVPFALFTQSSTGLFLADSNVRVVNIQQMLAAALPIVIFVPLLLFWHGGLWTVFVVWAACYVVAAAFTVWALRRYRNRYDGDDSAPIVTEQLKYGALVSLNSTMSFLNFRIDVFLIMFMLGHSALGVYSIGIGIGELLWQLSRPIATAAFGRIARGTEAEAAETTATCMRHSFALVLLGSVIVFFLAPPLVPLVYGPAFAQAGTVARLLLPGIIAYSMMPTLSNFFSQQLGKPRLPLVFSTTSTVVCAVSTVLLLPRLGIAGGAIATSVSYIIAFTAATAFFVRRTRIRPLRLFALSRADLHPYRALFWRKVGVSIK